MENAVFDTVLGLTFTFYCISLITSTLLEAVASALRWRAKTLLKGIKDLLNDPNFDGLAFEVYKHALVNPRENTSGASPGTAISFAQKPSYVSANSFASALLATVDVVRDLPEESKKAIAASRLLDEQLKQYFNGLIDHANNDVTLIRAHVAAWFDDAMDRVSGAYKRNAQLFSFLIALAVAVVLNIDTFRVAQAFWHQPLITKGFTVPSSPDVMKGIEDLKGADLPIGWAGRNPLEACQTSARTCATTLLFPVPGWLFSAVAALFGAPFWFGLLQKIINLRGTGPSSDKNPQSPGS